TSSEPEIETAAAKSSNTANEGNVVNQTEVSNSSQISDTSSELETTAAKPSNTADEVKIPEEIEQELNKNAENMNKLFKSNIKDATDQIDNEFGALSSVEKDGVTGRAKSQKSILAKLEKKFKDGKLKSTSTEACTDAIGDAYGTRVQIKSLSTERSKEIIEDCLSGSDITYEQFIKYMNGDTLNLDDASITALNEMKGTIIDLLKEEQTQEVVDQLVDAIGNGRLTITELNNYGDDISSYFTNAQLQEIADAYYIQTGEKLTLVTADDFTNGSGTKFDMNSSSDYTVNIDTSKAVKDSGYATSQMNTQQLLKDGTTGNGELQIRGSALNEFADAEHIPYDIKSGKITDIDTKYSDVYGTIKSMIEDGTYDNYNQYIVDTYQHLRLQELGIETVKPDITSYVSDLSEETASLLSMEGLISISKRGH
ncbi:MAG: hypothetical protein LUH05_06365, partial [Candidatus Gastranaerophilales bacterium]|nr:hypothetical protein [Candidatus Gastranaerophilales bacterium]